MKNEIKNPDHIRVGDEVRFIFSDGSLDSVDTVDEINIDQIRDDIRNPTSPGKWRWHTRMRPEKFADLRTGDVILTLPHWLGSRRNKQAQVKNGYGVPYFLFDDGYQIAIVEGWDGQWECIRRVDDDQPFPTTPSILQPTILFSMPLIAKVGENTAETQERVYQVGVSQIRRTYREWPYGKHLARRVAQENLEFFWKEK